MDDLTVTSFLDRMIAYRNAICDEYTLKVDHRHCIGCLLVMQYMKENHPNMQYGTKKQWEEEEGYCARHEREIFKEFMSQERQNAITKKE